MFQVSKSGLGRRDIEKENVVYVMYPNKGAMKVGI